MTVVVVMMVYIFYENQKRSWEQRIILCIYNLSGLETIYATFLKLAITTRAKPSRVGSIWTPFYHQHLAKLATTISFFTASTEVHLGPQFILLASWNMIPVSPIKKMVVYTLISSCTLANIALYNFSILLILNPLESAPSLHFAIVDLTYFLITTIKKISSANDTPKQPPPNYTD